MTRKRNAALSAARTFIPALCAAFVALPTAAHAQSARLPGSSTRAGDVPLPPPPAGTALRAPGTTSITFAVGPMAPFDGRDALAFQVDYGFPGNVSGMLEWHVPVTVSLPKTSADITEMMPTIPGGPYVTVVTGRKTNDAVVVEIVPTARLVYALAPGVALHADGGAGIAETVEKIVEEEQSVGRTETTKLTTAPVLRLAAGLTYDVGDHLRVSFQPIVVSWQLGADWSHFSALLGIAYRL